MLLIVLSLCGFAGALATRLLDPLITSIAADFHTTVAYVALLSSAFALPFGLSSAQNPRSFVCFGVVFLEGLAIYGIMPSSETCCDLKVQVGFGKQDS